MAAEKKRRMPLIPFTRSWREHRKARKESSENTDIGNRQAAKGAEVSLPQTVAIQLTTSDAVTKQQTATEPHSRNEKTEKVLAQYGHHGAVGWVAPVSSADRPIRGENMWRNMVTTITSEPSSILCIEIVCIAGDQDGRKDWGGIAIVPLRCSFLWPIPIKWRSH